MRMRTLGIAAALAAGWIQDSDAVIRQKSADAPQVSGDRGPRARRTIGYGSIAQLGWKAIFDRDTDVPLRLWGKGVLAPGAVADPAIAEAAARAFLRDHLATLAPGSSVADFVLVSNRLGGSGDTRSVGFEQRAQGLRVLGGAIGFTFKRDRMIMVGSTALPNVSVAVPGTRMANATVAAKATGWLAADGFETQVSLSRGAVAADRVIVPIVRPRRGQAIDVTYQVAHQVALDSRDGTPGAWDVWVDAASGAPILRANKLHFSSGKVMYDVPERHPGSVRSAKAPMFVNHTIAGAVSTTTVDGTVSWAGTGSATVTPGLRGPRIAISNAGGALATDSLTLPNNGTVTWSRASSETADAQLSAFVHAAIAKQFAKTRLDPNLPWLDATLSVSVNESGTCNAYSTGDDIHFLRKGQCENTARLADVVYHEFGHSLHNHAIIEGVGSWDGALSEGMSDVLAALLTNDAGMGRGFFLSNAPMRNLDPAQDLRWPEDTTGEVHDDGEIIGGTMWDVKKALEAKLGTEAGHAKTVEIFYGILQRANDIPSSYAEALVSDDDDGDLSNGTPNQCELNTVFKAHGLADGVVTAGLAAPVRDNFAISLDVTPPSGDCPGPAVARAEVEWRLRGGEIEKIDLVKTDNLFAAAIPAQPSGSVVQYKITVTLENGSMVSYPNNVADPFYEFYVGYTAPLWCADFEQRSADWVTGGTGDDWQVGAPLGLASDPKQAFRGTGVFGTDLSQDGAYGKQVSTFAETIEIDLEGHADARLQLRRWLGVEDAFYDHARILINDQLVWENHASQTEPQQNGTNHIDREWRFADFDLAPFAGAGKVKIRFELETDEGLQMGGWTLDDVCVVVPAIRPPNCGNGEVDDDEVCDDGNLEDNDGCSAACEDEGAGGGTDDGNVAGGCCSSSSGAPGALGLGALVLGLVLRRRRRV
jgi:uncharacterized protein (TIGR03382 family)